MRQGLLIALLGLVVTFASLSLLALVMGAIGRAERWRRTLTQRRFQAEADRRAGDEPDGISPETVAVIAAAVEVAAGSPARVRTVRYLRGREGSWSRMGRLQVMASHAVVRREP